MIQGRYGRENTLLKDGKYIKDLSYINRPLKDVVYIDYSDESVVHHQDNCILLSNFEGDKDDRDLIDLIPFLDRKLKHNYLHLFLFTDLAKYQGDVRKEIARYGRDTCGKKFLE